MGTLWGVLHCSMSPQGFFKVHIVQGGDPGHLCIHSPVRASNDAVGQLDQHRQVRPHRHHQGVAAAVSTASSVAAADTAHRDTATADTADNNTATAAAADTAAASVNTPVITAAAAWLLRLSPFPSTYPSTTCGGRVYTAGVPRVRVHRTLFFLTLYPYLLHIVGFVGCS